MAVEDPGKRISLPAYQDLSGYQYRFVKLVGAGQLDRVVFCSAAADISVGVMQNKPSAQDRTGSVMINGITQLIAGAALAEGYLLVPDAQGRAVQGGAGNLARAIALESAAAAGIRFRALLAWVKV
jgi:hypothetical protein